MQQRKSKQTTSPQPSKDPEYIYRQLNGNFALFIRATVPGALNDDVFYFINYPTSQKVFISGHITWFLFKFKLHGFTSLQEI